jgi:hypothetical protein
VTDAEFWAALERLLQADDAGADVHALAESLLSRNDGLSAQLESAVHSLDRPALRRATESLGLGAGEDAQIAVALAVVAAGQTSYEAAVADPARLQRPWDVSRGDLLLLLSPGLTLDPQVQSNSYLSGINLSLGGSSFGWPRFIAEAIAHTICNREGATARWMALLRAHDANRLLIHLDAAPNNAPRITRTRHRMPGYVQVKASWPTPASPFQWRRDVHAILNAVADHLDAI